MNENEKNEINVPESAPEEVAASIAPAEETFDFSTLKPKVKPIGKILFIVFLIVCIGLGLFFSFYSVSLELYEFSEKDGGYELSAFHNDNSVTSVTFDRVMEKKGNKWEATDKPITSIKRYALCGDSVLTEINIGKDVAFIDYQAFYSCTALRKINVDTRNEHYCSDEGILYNKDKTEILLFPICYCENASDALSSAVSARKETNEKGEETTFLTFTVPESVATIGELCFSDVKNVEKVTLPSGLKEMKTLAFFKCKALKEISLPDGLEKIGSDAFSYCSKLTYMYIPASVTEIGHHAFFDCDGIGQMCVAAGKDDFKKVETGDQWLPQTYVSGAKLFSKDIEILYGQERRSE